MVLYKMVLTGMFLLLAGILIGLPSLLFYDSMVLMIDHFDPHYYTEFVKYVI